MARFGTDEDGLAFLHAISSQGCASLIEQSNSGAYCHVSVCKYARPGNCSVNQDNWLEKTLADRSNCGKACPDDICGGGEK
eukprot:scaffold1371_cov77-Skeletonema_dohrnii-CCMP3373.AAC.6